MLSLEDSLGVKKAALNKDRGIQRLDKQDLNQASPSGPPDIPSTCCHGLETPLLQSLCRAPLTPSSQLPTNGLKILYFCMGKLRPETAPLSLTPHASTLGCSPETLSPPTKASLLPSQSPGLLRSTIYPERAGHQAHGGTVCKRKGGQEHAKVHTGPAAVPTDALGTSPGHPGSTGRSIMHEAPCV